MVSPSSGSSRHWRRSTSLTDTSAARPAHSRWARVKRGTALGVTALLVATGVVTQATPLAHAAGRTVTLVGSLQDELGCSADWQPTCTQTQLAQAGATTYSKTFSVPAGSYEYKIAINQSWSENYGVGGAANGGNYPVTLAGPASITVTYDDATHQVSFTPNTLAGAATQADKALAKDSLRAAQTRERFYFLMADRFANGDASNDTGGISGGPLKSGLNPADKGFYHGGDLKGVINKLDYIKGLGTTAIWLTPSFKNNPVQGSGADASAGYHGYWITDFTTIDPHLGTNADMKALIAAAHKKGMKVYFDIITNHTADIIKYAQNQYSYIPESQVPYKDASGNVFDPSAVANTSAFPKLNLQSFPYTPVIDPADANVKVPAWLNDPTMYHNRGDSTYQGESATFGDFSGLDDLFTERPEVLTGMENIYKKWVDFGVDGFRIDTVKHVNIEFWQQFIPSMRAEAAKQGNNKFFMFGEIYDANPQVESTYTTTGKLQAALDFGFQSAALSAVQGKPTTQLRDFFASDDWFTDADSNAYQSPTFLGNHDMGRIGMMLSQAGYTGTDLLKRTLLANDLMYLVRGNPVTYYGDEQGFIGNGGDKDAREDMFGTKVAQYAAEPLIGGGTMGTGSHYGTGGTIYQHVSGLAALRAKYPALADGAQINRYSSGAAGVYAMSRVGTDDSREYIVAINNSAKDASATFQTYTPHAQWRPLYGSRKQLTSGKDSRITISVPALSVSVWQANKPLPQRKAAPAVYFKSPAAGSVVAGRTEVSASIPENTFAEVSFDYRPVGTSQWTYLGTDDNAPYRVFADVSKLPMNELIEYRVVVKDRSDNISATSTFAKVGAQASSGTTTGSTPISGPVTQPAQVSVPGTHQQAMGCANNWDPACTQAQLSLDANDHVWKGTYTSIPAGEYQFKAAIDGSWTENYGAGGAPNGANLTYNAPGGAPVTFYYDHATHYVTNDALGPILTAPGSFQTALGCSANWDPACMQPWLQDPDGDGVYTWATASLPAGNYEFKVAEGLSFATNYGAGGVANGSNIALSVPSAGQLVTISYNMATHAITTSVTTPGLKPDLSTSRAIWVAPDVVAWPKAGLPTDPARLSLALYWSASKQLSVDAQALVAPDAKVATLTYNPAGFTKAQLAAHPELTDYLALQVDKKTAKQVKTIATAQVAGAMFDDLGTLLDATGVQTSYVK